MVGRAHANSVARHRCHLAAAEPPRGDKGTSTAGMTYTHSIIRRTTAKDIIQTPPTLLDAATAV